MVGFTNAGGSLEKLGIRIFTSKPANPKNGDIVVWTGTTPTAVEITPFKITADRSDSYDNGHVYIRLDTAAGAFDVAYGAWLKEKNPAIWLSSYWGPVLQKIGGKYQYMNAQIYFDGLWHKISSNWDGTLYYNGDQYANVTGGWLGAGSTSPNLYEENVFDGGWGDTAGGGFITASKVDLTGWKTLWVTGKGEGKTDYDSSTSDVYAGIKSAAGRAWVSNVNMGHTADLTTVALDISGITGSYYISIFVDGNRRHNITVSKVWLTA